MFNHEFLTASFRRPASHHDQQFPRCLAQCLDYSRLMVNFPMTFMGSVLPSHSHILFHLTLQCVPLKRKKTFFLPLGFDFGYVTCFGQWNICGSKAWRADQKLGKNLEMRLIFLILYCCHERYVPGVSLQPQKEDERLTEESCINHYHSQALARSVSPYPSPAELPSRTRPKLSIPKSPHKFVAV